MIRRFLLLTILLLVLPNISLAQFSSGSTGADGALDLSSINCPDNTCRIQLPASGILNYTTINIPTGKTLRFIPNLQNTPVILLAQGGVTINGTISVSSIGDKGCPATKPREVAPGGFRGGAPGRDGFGPGGGQFGTADRDGRWIGPLSLTPIVGGSGGAGPLPGSRFDGGDGGGAIMIASSTSIIGNGSIVADGSQHGNCSTSTSWGSGGAIRLVSNSIDFSGGLGAKGGSRSHDGVVRLEATSLVFTGSSTPAAVLSLINPIVVSGNQPRLTIQSVGGYSVPSYSGSRFDTVDLLLPNQIQDPVSVVVRAENIPLGSEVRVGFASGSQNGTSSACNLSGTFSTSTCTATISNLNRSAVTYLLATTTFAPPESLAQFNKGGADQVAQVKVESILGAEPKFVFLNSRSDVIDNSKIPREFLQYFGM